MKYNFYIKQRINAYKKSNGFGLTEAIVSIVLLSTLLAYSVMFISKRHSVLHKANLTNAINDEIRRDIEKLKMSLWETHYVPKKGNAPAHYDLNFQGSTDFYCSDVFNTLKLISKQTTTWEPGASPGSVSGQRRNTVFTGKPISITRQILSARPFNIGNNSTVDKSIAHIVYSVRKKGSNVTTHWTSVDVSSEAHSWCTPR